MAKDFENVKTTRQNSALFEGIEKGTQTRKQQQTTATPEEVARRQSEGKTQGRKGCKSMRYNVAFTPENYEFIRIMSRATGRTMTKFINAVIETYRKEHPELADQAEAFLDTVNSTLSQD